MDRRTTPGCHGAEIVGYAGMSLGESAQAVLEAHWERGGARLRAIYRATGWDPTLSIRSYRDQSAGMPLDQTMRRGVACVARMGLSFDVQGHHDQLLEVASLARAFPEMPIIVDHTGVPVGVGPCVAKREEAFRRWRGLISELASDPTVYLMLGGMDMAVFGFGRHEPPAPPSSPECAHATAPFSRACVELLGAGRCMVENNYPVDRSACQYVVMGNTLCESRGTSLPTKSATCSTILPLGLIG